MAASNHTPKRPTWTRLTVDAIKTVDNFLSAPQLCDLTGATVRQMSATLHHLQAKNVVDVVVEQGIPYWFLTGDDQRLRQFDEAREYDTRNRKIGYASKRKLKIFPANQKKGAKQ